MTDAIVKNLEKGIQLLHTITDEQYSNSTVLPYCSSIGCHTRHVLDVFSCVLDGLEDKYIDLTKRKRNERIELKTANGIEYYEAIIHQLNKISKQDLNIQVNVIDDMGLGKEKAKYTLGAILMQAQSHAIHHFASIGFIIFQLGIDLPDSDFGYNPTTPNKNLRAS